MNHSIPLAVLDSVIPADEANPQQVKRMIQVADQRLLGLTGGGPLCPKCDARALEPMPESSLRQCRHCLVAVRLRVSGGSLKAEVVTASPRIIEYGPFRAAEGLRG